MHWIFLFGAAGLLTVWLCAIGELLARTLGVDPIAARAVAPVSAVGFIGVLTVVAGEWGIPWRPLFVVPLLVVLAGAMAIASSLSASGSSTYGSHAGTAAPPAPTDLPLVVGVLLSAGIQVGILRKAAVTVTAINQNNDAIFHLNLIAEIRSSGIASPLTSAEAITGSGYYPNVFHAIAALLGESLPVPLAYNVVMFAVSGFIFAAGVGQLVRALGLGNAEVVIAPAVAGSTIWFPSTMLYGNAQVAAALSVALIPGVLAGIIEEKRRRNARGLALASIVSAVGLGAAHPGGLQWALVLASFLLLVNLRSILDALGIARARRPLARLAVLFCAFAPLLLMMSTPRLEEMGSYPRLPLPSAVSAAAPLLLPMKDQSPWMNLPLVLLGIAGLLVLARRREATPLVAWAVSGGLVWITFLPSGPWTALVGAWWGDPNRYYAIEAMLLGVGAAALMGEVLRPHASRSSARRAAGGLVCSLLALVLVVSSVPRAIHWTNEGYSVTERKYPAWLTVAEKDWMVATARRLPEDAIVYGDPQTGAAFFSVLTDIESANRFQGTPLDDGERGYLAENLRFIETDPDVCDAIIRIGGTPYFYSDSSIPDWMTEMVFPGYVGIDFSSRFEAVSSFEGATLWRITACAN